MIKSMTVLLSINRLSVKFASKHLFTCFRTIDEIKASWPQPFLGENKPSLLTGGKFKISYITDLIVLNDNDAFVLGIRSTHTNGQTILLLYEVFADQ